MKSYKIILSCLLVFCMASLGLQAQRKTINEARVYINPGHGGWGSNDRPMATINYPALDTLGFFETHTNLWKSLSLRDELIKAGVGFVKMSRTVNGIYVPNDPDYPAFPNSSPNAKYPEIPTGTIVGGIAQNIGLSVIAADVETNNMDYFISIHSNATTEGAATNWLVLLYRGTDFSPYLGNGLVDARNMGINAWPYINDNDITYHSAYHSTAPNFPNNINVRGDMTAQNGSSTTITAGKSYTGYFAVLKHGCDGYLSEGCFHTYHPERQRLLNKDYCRQEGVRHSRAIRSWFGDNTETKGCIMGTVKDSNRSLNHPLYANARGNDVYYPLNRAEVILKNSDGVKIGTYTTDNEYNGVFVFTDLVPGKYTLVFNADKSVPATADFEEVTKEIEVKANKTAFINHLFGTGEPTQPQANIYTSGLKVSAVEANRDITFTYTLNAPASEVVISVSNGDVFTITAGVGLSKGVNTVTKQLSDGTVAGTYTWTVTATAANNNAMALTAINNSVEQRFRFYYPMGLTVDNSFDSPYFGTIYVSEATGSSPIEGSGYFGAGIRGNTGDGIYAFDPLLDPLNDTPHTGGISWTSSPYPEDYTKGWGSPWRLSVNDAGMVYVADCSKDNSGVYIMDPGNPKSFTPALANTGRNTEGLVAGVHGRVGGIWVEGSGSNTTLYTIDDNYLPSGHPNNQYMTSGMLFKYEIGETVPYAGTPTVIYSNNYTGDKIATAQLTLASDRRGGWWIYQTRTVADNAEVPALMHIPAGGNTCNYRSTDQNLFSGIAAASRRGAMATNKAGTLLAVGSDAKVKLYSVTYTGETPSLTLKAESGTLNHIDGIAFDIADNIYAVSAPIEQFYCFPAPKGSGSASTGENTSATSAPASQKIVFSGTSINVPAVEKIGVVCLGNQITIISNSPILSAKLFDLQGRTIKSKQVGSTLTAPDKGIYIVEIVTENGRNVQKVAVHN